MKAWHHARVGEDDQHGIYRIKDDMVSGFANSGLEKCLANSTQVYTLWLEQKKGDKWVAFTPSDVQLEAVMLDPYIRRNFTVVGRTKL